MAGDGGDVEGEVGGFVGSEDGSSLGEVGDELVLGEISPG